jgi:hypothetical protein
MNYISRHNTIAFLRTPTAKKSYAFIGSLYGIKTITKTICRVLKRSLSSTNIIINIPFFLLIIVLFLLPIPNGWAQDSKFTGPEKLELIAIAREPVAAAFEGRAPRSPLPNPKYNRAYPLVVSLFLNGELVARSWEIQRPAPLIDSLPSLVSQVLTDPKYGRVITPEEEESVKFGVGVFSRFEQIQDDKGVKQGDGVVVLVGFKEGVALPSDVPTGAAAADLLSRASEIGNMRKGGWLLPNASIFRAYVDEVIEK